MKYLKNALTFPFILSLILFAIVCYLFVKIEMINRIDQDRLYELTVKLKNKNDLVGTLVENSKIVHVTNGEKIKKSTKVKNEKNKLFLLEDVIGQQPKLVFRYSKLHCQVCVDKEIKLIKEITQEIGDKNILILSYYDSYRDLSLFKRINKLSNDIYNVMDIELPPEKYNIPYYFIVDNDLVISEVMIPNKYIPEMSKSYLYSIKKKYFNNSK